MIWCGECDTPRFLQITKSRILLFEEGEPIRELEEQYKCTCCGSTGTFWFEDGEGKVSGDMKVINEQPRACP